MTTQEEIRDGIYGLLEPYIADEPWKAEVIFVLTNKILKFLDDKNARIIVLRESPIGKGKKHFDINCERLICTGSNGSHILLLLDD